jgi:hypothetical protein
LTLAIDTASDFDSLIPTARRLWRRLCAREETTNLAPKEKNGKKNHDQPPLSLLFKKKPHLYRRTEG